MKKLLILGLILICLLARAQENQLIVMFYNTENLFDTEDDPEKTDEGFKHPTKISLINFNLLAFGTKNSL